MQRFYEFHYSLEVRLPFKRGSNFTPMIPVMSGNDTLTIQAPNIGQALIKAQDHIESLCCNDSLIVNKLEVVEVTNSSMPEDEISEEYDLADSRLPIANPVVTQADLEATADLWDKADTKKRDSWLAFAFNNSESENARCTRAQYNFDAFSITTQRRLALTRDSFALMLEVGAVKYDDVEASWDNASTADSKRWADLCKIKFVDDAEELPFRLLNVETQRKLIATYNEFACLPPV